MVVGQEKYQDSKPFVAAGRFNRPEGAAVEGGCWRLLGWSPVMVNLENPFWGMILEEIKISSKGIQMSHKARPLMILLGLIMRSHPISMERYVCGGLDWNYYMYQMSLREVLLSTDLQKSSKDEALRLKDVATSSPTSSTRCVCKRWNHWNGPHTISSPTIGIIHQPTPKKTTPADINTYIIYNILIWWHACETWNIKHKDAGTSIIWVAHPELP